MSLLSTVLVDVSAVDMKKRSILLKLTSAKRGERKSDTRTPHGMNIGDEIAGAVEIVDIKFERINVKLLDSKFNDGKADRKSVV